MSTDQDYYGHSRPEMIPFVPASARSVLEIGCGAGGFAAELRKARTRQDRQLEIWGVELDPDVARRAESHVERVLIGDVLSCLSEIPEAAFDAVIMNDVIEHIAEPEPILRGLASRLRPGGSLIASVPNVRYFHNVADLALHGRWDYTDEGILDRTHLRFYTRSSVERLLGACGYQVDSVTGINRTRSMKFRLFNLLSLGRFSDMGYLQFACVAHPRTTV